MRDGDGTSVEAAANRNAAQAKGGDDVEGLVDDDGNVAWVPSSWPSTWNKFLIYLQNLYRFRKKYKTEKTICFVFANLKKY